MTEHDQSLQKKVDDELNRKRTELHQLEAELIQAELQRATLEAELAVFEQYYLRTVGKRLAELDEVRARMAEAVARLDPASRIRTEKAEQARYKAKEADHEASDAAPGETRTEFSPTDTLRKLYRDLARQVHPDLARSDDDRALRNTIMAQVNMAYAAGDEDELRRILAEWQNQAALGQMSARDAELAHIEKTISEIRRRLKGIDVEASDMKQSDLGVLKQQADEAETGGRDLLSEMTNNVEAQIDDAWRRVRQAVNFLSLPD